MRESGSGIDAMHAVDMMTGVELGCTTWEKNVLSGCMGQSGASPSSDPYSEPISSAILAKSWIEPEKLPGDAQKKGAEQMAKARAGKRKSSRLIKMAQMVGDTGCWRP